MAKKHSPETLALFIGGQRSPSGPSHITVEERRAPTDETMQLMRDIEKELTDKIKGMIHVEESGFHAAIYMSAETFHDRLNVKARLGETEVHAHYDRKPLDHTNDVLEGLIKALATELSVALLTPLFNKSETRSLIG